MRESERVNDVNGVTELRDDKAPRRSYPQTNPTSDSLRRPALTP
jgi:hypothetical protein